MALKLTVKQIADAQVSLDLVYPIFNWGMVNAPTLHGENGDKIKKELYQAFGKLRQLVKELNEVEVSVKG